jgi:type IV secretion system protein VirB6
MSITSFVFSDLWSYVLTYLQTYVISPTGGLVTALISSVLVVHVIFVGVSYTTGHGAVRLMDLVSGALALAAIFLLALYLQEHLDELMSDINGSLEGLLGALDRGARSTGGSETPRIAGYLGFLDEVTTKGNQLTKLFLDRGVPVTKDELSSWMGLLIMGSTVVPTGIAGGLILLSQIALRLLLAIGPIFFIFLIFRSTRGYFDAWLSLLLNIFLMSVLLMVASRIIFTFWSAACDIAIEDPRMINVVRLFTVSVVALLFSVVVPLLASRLTANVRGAAHALYVGVQRQLA